MGVQMIVPRVPASASGVFDIGESNARYATAWLTGLDSSGGVTFATSILSTTALATPAALTATQFTGFASTVSGAAVMGYGTTNDVTLMNRGGTAVVGVTANTSNVTMAGALAITGALSGVTTLTATTLVGTLSTAAQPNITSLGTLTVLAVSGTITHTSSSATAFVSGPNGVTNPVLTLNNSTASQAAGLQITGAIAAGTVALAVISSGANASATFDAKGSGTIGIGTISTGAITLGQATTITTGGLTVSAGGGVITGNPAGTFRSGAAGTNARVFIGRTSDELSLNIAGAAGQIVTGAVAGDSVLRWEAQTFYFSSAGTDVGNISSAGSWTLKGALTTASSITTQANGIYVNSTSTNNSIHTASQGAGSTTLYIGNASITVSSDIRLKRNVSDTAGLALPLLRQLRIRDFEWDDPSDTAEANRNTRGRWQFGVVAQEAIGIVPWLVNAPDRTCPHCAAGQKCRRHDSYWQVDWGHDFGLLVKGIQELDARLTAAGIV